MAANKRRGEISARLNGRERRLCLTLGSLADLETALGAGDLVALGQRFSSGRLSARDMLAVLAAGLRGGGERVSDDEAASLTADGGIGELARIVTELLAVTFLTDEQRSEAKPATPANPG